MKEYWDSRSTPQFICAVDTAKPPKKVLAKLFTNPDARVAYQHVIVVDPETKEAIDFADELKKLHEKLDALLERKRA